MPVVNPLARELVFKVVYYGPGLGGKTTNLQHIHQTTQPEHRGRLVSLATPVDRTLYFDFLPLRLPAVRGMSVRLQLFTVPGQVYYNATRKLVLTGADGLVLVVDSQRERVDANSESLENLRENLREHGRTLDAVPWVIQYNKRDLPSPLPVAELQRKLNPQGVPAFESVAMRGEGVYETLEAITRLVLGELERRLPDEADAGGPALALVEGGLTGALQTASRDRPVSAPPPDPSVRPAAPGGGPPLSARGSGPESEAPASDSGRFRPPTLPSLRAAELQAQRAPPAVELVERARSAPFSFAPLFATSEQALAREIEALLSSGDASGAIERADHLASRLLASVAAVLGRARDAPRDPALAALLLGVPGVRYLRFRELVRHARQRAVSPEHGLEAYGFVLELLRARSEVRLSSSG